MMPTSFEDPTIRLRFLRRILRRIDDEGWTIRIAFLEGRKAESNPETLEVTVCPHEDMLRSLLHEAIHAAEADTGLSEAEIEEIAHRLVAELRPIQKRMLFRKYFGGITL